jgi:23S rRNA pseudouridine2605 synthase
MEERLQKILSRAGISSRRAAEKMMAEGRISVNGTVAVEPGTKADPARDEIRVDGRLISLEAESVYLILHKPKGYMTTMKDPQGRPIVTDLLSGMETRVYPVGRLDYDSEGLLILTNDGEFAQRLLHPRYGIPKTYRIKVEGHLNKDELKALERGILLDDGRFAPQAMQVDKTNPRSTWLTVTLTSGRNRVIRRAFDSMGHSVTRLIRVAIADIVLAPLKEGTWRLLNPREVGQLMALTGNRKRQKSMKKLS